MVSLDNPNNPFIVGLSAYRTFVAIALMRNYSPDERKYAMETLKQFTLEVVDTLVSNREMFSHTEFAAEYSEFMGLIETAVVGGSPDDRKWDDYISS